MGTGSVPMELKENAASARAAGLLGGFPSLRPVAEPVVLGDCATVGIDDVHVVADPAEKNINSTASERPLTSMAESQVCWARIRKPIVTQS